MGFLAGTGSHKDYPTDGVAIPCKPGVCLEVTPVVINAWPKIQKAFRAHGYEAVCTSANDGTHSDGSLHYVGKALDLRSRHIPMEEQQLILKSLRDTLGADWDVILESDHYHLEYDPD